MQILFCKLLKIHSLNPALSISLSLICLHLNILCLNHSLLLDILKVLHKEKTQSYCTDFQSTPPNYSESTETTGRKECIHCWSNHTERVKMLSWRLAPVKKSLTAISIHAIHTQYTVLIAKESRTASGTNINKLM